MHLTPVLGSETRIYFVKAGFNPLAYDEPSNMRVPTARSHIVTSALQKDTAHYNPLQTFLRTHETHLRTTSFDDAFPDFEYICKLRQPEIYRMKKHHTLSAIQTDIWLNHGRLCISKIWPLLISLNLQLI